MEQHSQYESQKVLYDKNTNYFSDHFTQHFTPIPSPKQRFNIISFEIPSMVKPLGLIKIWGKSSCTLCTK